VSLVTEVAALAALRGLNPAAVTGSDADVVTPELAAVVREAVARPDFPSWAARVASTGYCAHPIHLRGLVQTVDRHGVVTGDGDRRSLLVRCGNRRAAVCPSCSFTYAGDVWQVLASGIAGGRHDVPTSVAGHPLVFVTLTAPSFGPVHTTRTSRAPGSGRALPCRPRRPDARHRCPHGRPLWCGHTHPGDDPALGTPLCPDCFDYAGLVAFNWDASDLWGRFTIDLRRALARRLGLTETQLRDVVRVRYAKVAEFQRRGVAHFHAVIRLDGPPVPAVHGTDEDPGDAFPPPRVPVSVDTLAAAVRAAAGTARLTVPDPTDIDGHGLAVVLRFGRQVDVRPIRSSAGDDLAADDLSPERVAAYIAKYATKAADDFGLPPTVRRAADLDRLGLDVTDHTRRILAVVDQLMARHPRAHKWAHQLGFRGHFQTKSRHFSVTLGALRAQRRTWRQTHPTPGLADPTTTAGAAAAARDLGDGDDDQDGEATTLVVRWTFAGTGHRTPAEAALAAAAADLARSRRTRRTDAA